MDFWVASSQFKNINVGRQLHSEFKRVKKTLCPKIGVS